MAGKATDALVIERTNKVYDLLIAGARRAEILEYAKKNAWDIATSTIDTYIARANVAFKREATFHRERELGKAIGRLNLLFAKSLRISDYKTALSVQKELSALMGLNAPSTVKVEDWRDQALRDVTTGKVPLDTLIEAFGGREALIDAFGGVSLAARLFTAAGVPVQVSENGE